MLWLNNFWDILSETLVSGVKSELTPEYAQKDNAFYQDWVDQCRLFYEANVPQDAKDIMVQKDKLLKSRDEALKKMIVETE